MSKEAMKLALEALHHCKDVIVERGLNGNPEFAEKWGLTLPLERSEAAITALREALAEQPAQQEPVAWVCLIAEADFSADTVTLAMQCTDYKVSAGEYWLSNTPPAQRKESK